MTKTTIEALRDIPAGHLFALLMSSDPWPVEDFGYGNGQAELIAFADRIAMAMGYTDWLDAYHSTNQDSTLAALSQGEAQQPEAVAWEVDGTEAGKRIVTKRGHADAFASDHRYTVRPLIYGDTTPTHDGGEDWKARALSAEADIERMTDTFNRENGPALMGEPVLPPEKMVELDPGVKVPTWLLDHAKRVELYMKANLPGPWRIGGIQSQDFTPPAAKQPEAQAVALKCPNCKGFGYTDEGDQEVGSALFDCDACLGSGLFTVPVGATIADAAYSPDLTMESARNLLRDIASAIKHGGYSHPTTPAVGGEDWTPVSDGLPPEGVMALVYWLEDGDERYDFDAIEDGAWVRHSEHYDHFLSVAPPENSRGPSEQAPYTHWRIIRAPGATSPVEPNMNELASNPYQLPETPEERFEQFVQQAIAKAPDPLRELGAYLSRVLDEDKFPSAERLLLQLATSHPTTPPVEPSSEGVRGLEWALAEFERRTKALPCQHETPERGCCTYSWQMAAIKEIRALATKPAKGGEE